MQVCFVYDYRSIYAYLANSQMSGLDADVDYQLVDIVAVMQQVNNQPTPKCPPKARYSRLDAQRWADIYGVDLAPNDALLAAIREGQLPDGYLLRAAIAAQRLGIFNRVNNALFRSVWAGSDDLVSVQGREIFSAANDIPAELWVLADTEEVHTQLAENTQNAVGRGVFGAPTFFIGDEMYFGNDRLNFVRQRLALSQSEHK